MPQPQWWSPRIHPELGFQAERLYMTILLRLQPRDFRIPTRHVANEVKKVRVLGAQPSTDVVPPANETGAKAQFMERQLFPRR